MNKNYQLPIANYQLQKYPGLFITGTDTGVGKTVVSCLLARELRKQGIKVGVMKPYACGSLSDTQALKKAAGRKDPLSDITPVYYSKPLAPIVRELTGSQGDRETGKRKNEFQEVIEKFKQWKKKSDFLIVEGAGGVMVPLYEKFTVLDMMKKFNLPVWVVARPGLGTLNHTFLTCEALKNRGLKIDRIVISGYRGKTAAEKTNPVILRKLTGLPVDVIPNINGQEKFVEIQ